MLLTIGMIVKNEEKYLEQCLTAMKPILEQVDSELIIADTGSTDRSVEIAKKFTDNVFYFEWIDDFAAARNSTLEKAKGEWYMFVDADEVFKDCSDIIKFFNSGEYKDYYCANFVQRNYNDLNDMTLYSDFRAARLSKRFPESKFVHPIHEALTPRCRPERFLDLIADHYGYLYKADSTSEEKVSPLAKKKSQRNLELLQKELEGLENVEDHIFIYKEISDCYKAIDEPEKALENLNIGLEKINHSLLPIVTYYAQKIGVLSRLDRDEEVLEVCEEYFDSERNPSRTHEVATDCYVYAMRGHSYFVLGQYDKAISALGSFARVYNKYLHNNLNTDDLFFDSFGASKPLVKHCVDVGLIACAHENRYDTANTLLRDIPISVYKDDHKYIAINLARRMEIMKHTGFRNLNKLYSELDEFGRERLLACLRFTLFGTDDKNSKEIVKNLNLIGRNDPRTADAERIYHSYFIEDDLNTDDLAEYLGKYGTDNSEEILYMLMGADIDISLYTDQKDFNIDDTCGIVFNNFSDALEVFEDYDIDVIMDYNLDIAAGMYRRIIQLAIFRMKKIAAAFEKYVLIGKKWYSIFVGGINIPEEIPDNLPAEIKLCLMAARVVDAIKSGGSADDAIEAVTNEVPSFGDFLRAYKREVAPNNESSSETAADNDTDEAPETSESALETSEQPTMSPEEAKELIGRSEKLIEEAKAVIQKAKSDIKKAKADIKSAEADIETAKAVLESEE